MGLRSELRALGSKHDESARAFEVNSGVGAVLVDFGLHWAEDQWDIPTSAARQEARRLRLSWTQSKQYRDLVSEFERLLGRVRTELSPMFRRALPLAGVYRATTLVSKIQQLDTTLAILEDRTRAWITFGRKPPVGVQRSTKAHRPRQPKRGFWLPRTLTEWVALISGVGVLASLVLPEVARVGPSLFSLSGALVSGLILVGAGTILVWQRARRTRRG
jgi:hypothetical protein